jgi:hypothetical protein
MEIDEVLLPKTNVEANPNPIAETNSQDVMESKTTGKQPLWNSFLKTNIYEDAPLKLTFEHVLRTFKDNIRKLCMSLSNMSILPSQISDEIRFMKEDSIQMFDALEKAYIREFEARLEAARLEAERVETERIEKERLEAERIERERIEAERLEALKKEQERLEEEARIAAEKAKIEELLRNAPEVALKITEDVKHQKIEQDALKEQVQTIQTSDANQKKNDDRFQQLYTMFMETCERILERLPPPP